MKRDKSTSNGSLLRNKGFLALNITQFWGALNDNAFKMLAVIVLVTKLDYELSKTLALASALLVAPFLIFSNWAGALADRYSKRSIILAVKWVELALLVLVRPGAVRAVPAVRRPPLRRHRAWHLRLP